MKNIVSALIVLFCNVCVIQASSLFKIDDNYLSQHDIVYLEPEFDSFNGFLLVMEISEVCYGLPTRALLYKLTK